MSDCHTVFCASVFIVAYLVFHFVLNIDIVVIKLWCCMLYAHDHAMLLSTFFVDRTICWCGGGRLSEWEVPVPGGGDCPTFTIDVLDVLCAQLTRDLFAIAKFLLSTRDVC